MTSRAPQDFAARKKRAVRREEQSRRLPSCGGRRKKSFQGRNDFRSSALPRGTVPEVRLVKKDSALTGTMKGGRIERATVGPRAAPERGKWRGREGATNMINAVNRVTNRNKISKK
ncbi:hypothetical protein NDU88_001992 [Pleurodeles waltl]|uniref:Uncharacterized protein n=1 Tax=Pleurodeles waltl TaxID=8319 RepID=A0AAV7UWA2_PLEWA|nr:hypothetical protein NDU88_001992 [Pleurodeles waltl]